MATGPEGGAYYELGKRYRAELENGGVRVLPVAYASMLYCEIILTSCATKSADSPVNKRLIDLNRQGLLSLLLALRVVSLYATIRRLLRAKRTGLMR